MGKSFITANLGASLARQGKKVVLIDLDLGASNLHTFLGVKNPRAGINSFLEKSVKTLADTVVPASIPNLFFISSLHCSMEIANLFHAQKIKLINAIKDLSFDYILLDLGAGTHFNTLDFFLTSDKGIFVCTPEPTAIENAFRFIKAVYLRILKKGIKQSTFQSAMETASDVHGQGPSESSDIIDEVLKYDPTKEQFLRDSLGNFQFKFIINQFRRMSDTNFGDKIQAVCNRHFYSDFQFLGNIVYDERVSTSILVKKLFIQKNPDAPASLDLRDISKRILRNGPMISGPSTAAAPAESS